MHLKDTTSSVFSLIYTNKSKSNVGSSIVIQNGMFPQGIAVFADWAGNIWSINLDKKNELWRHKYKEIFIFDFQLINEKIYAFYKFGVVVIAPETGAIIKKNEIGNIHSLIWCNSKFYFQDRKRGTSSTGQFVEFDPDSMEEKIIYKEETKRDLINYVKCEISKYDSSKILFFADSKFRIYDPIQNKSEVLSSVNLDSVSGLAVAGKHIFFVGFFDVSKDEKLKNDPNYQKLLHIDSSLKMEPIVDTTYKQNLPYAGTTLQLGPEHFILCFADRVFEISNGSVNPIPISLDRLPRDAYWRRKFQYFSVDTMNNKNFLFAPCSFGEYAEQSGFAILELGVNRTWEVSETFIAGKSNSSAQDCRLNIFGSFATICGDSFYYIMEFKKR